jgi:hypothetical protein
MSVKDPSKDMRPLTPEEQAALEAQQNLFDDPLEQLQRMIQSDRQQEQELDLTEDYQAFDGDPVVIEEQILPEGQIWSDDAYYIEESQEYVDDRAYPFLNEATARDELDDDIESAIMADRHRQTPAYQDMETSRFAGKGLILAALAGLGLAGILGFVGYSYMSASGSGDVMLVKADGSPREQLLPDKPSLTAWAARNQQMMPVWPQAMIAQHPRYPASFQPTTNLPPQEQAQIRPQQPLLQSPSVCAL